MKRAFISILLIVLFGFSMAAGGNVWKVGIARTVITPEKPVWLAGFASRTAPSSGTAIDIWAKALALEDSLGYKAVIVTCDVLGFPKDVSDEIRDQVSKKYGLDRSRIILSASHTHSGPVLSKSLYFIYPLTASDQKNVERYLKIFKKKILNVIDDALKDMNPARLYSGNGICRFAVNRRNNRASALNSTTDLKGPSDYAVPVLKIENLDGSIKAILFGYACHPTTLSGLKFSGDYPGYTQIELEKLYPGAIAMFFQGAGADQNALPRGADNTLQTPYTIQYGKQLAASVEQVMSGKMSPLESMLNTEYKEIDLALDAPVSEEELRKLAKGKDFQARWAKAMLDKSDDIIYKGKTYPYPIAYWQIGRQRLFVLGGELVSGYSIRLKQKYGYDIFVMGYANDVMSYIPTTTVWKEGGYEGFIAPRVYALPARWTGDVEERIFNAITEMVSSDNN